MMQKLTFRCYLNEENHGLRHDSTRNRLLPDVAVPPCYEPQHRTESRARRSAQSEPGIAHLWKCSHHFSESH